MPPRNAPTSAPLDGATPGPSLRPRRAVASLRKSTVVDVRGGDASSSGNESESEGCVVPQRNTRSRGKQTVAAPEVTQASTAAGGPGRASRKAASPSAAGGLAGLAGKPQPSRAAPTPRTTRAQSQRRAKPMAGSQASDSEAQADPDSASSSESDQEEATGQQVEGRKAARKRADTNPPVRPTRTTRQCAAAAVTTRANGRKTAAATPLPPLAPSSSAATAQKENSSSEGSDDEEDEEEEAEKEEEGGEEEEGQIRPVVAPRGQGGGKGMQSLVPPTAAESRKRMFELLERRIGGATAAAAASADAAASCRTLYGELPLKNPQKKAKLFMDLKSQFDDWHSRLRSGFSVLLYGFGSKRGLLDEFARFLAGPRNRGDAAVLVFHGYNPRCTAKEVVSSVASALMQRTFKNLGAGGAAAAAAVAGLGGGGGGAPAVLRTLVEDILLEPLDRHAFVVIHNIDGSGLRGDVPLLSALAACPQVHVIASIDHALAPLLWDSADAARFRWQYMNATTFQPYLSETSGMQSVLLDAFKSGTVTAGAGTVLRSLVLGAQEVFKVLAEHLLEDEECEGVAFVHLFRMCRERYLVRDEHVLRQHLVEFVDHQLMRLRPASDNSGELLTIPMTRPDIQAVLEDLRAARAD